MANTTVNTFDKSVKRKRLYENISCITVDADCGEYELKGLTYFDVPLETYNDGCLTGTRLVYELLKEAAQDDSFDRLVNVLEESSKELGGSGGKPDTASKRGAAVGFAGTLQEVFNFAASRLDFTEVFKHTFDFHEAYLVEQLDAMRKTNAGILADLPANSAPILEGASA